MTCKRIVLRPSSDNVNIREITRGNSSDQSKERSGISRVIKKIMWNFPSVLVFGLEISKKYSTVS